MAALSLISIKKYKTKLRPRKPLRAIFYAPASAPAFPDCKPPTGEIHEEIEGVGRQGKLYLLNVTNRNKEKRSDRRQQADSI